MTPTPRQFAVVCFVPFSNTDNTVGAYERNRSQKSQRTHRTATYPARNSNTRSVYLVGA